MRGAVGGDLKSQAVDDILNSFDLGGMGYAFLVDDQGSVLVHPDKSLVLKKLADLYPGSTPRLESDLQNAVAVDGSARIVTFLPVQGLAGGAGMSACRWTRARRSRRCVRHAFAR